MSLGLLAPLFAAGIAAVAIPLLVHLVHKEKRDAVAFPSLKFLRRMPYPFSSRQRLRDVLLFLLRSGLIVLAALAFARPVFARLDAPVAADQAGREVVVLLDRSFSMGMGTRWQRAREETRKIIDGMGVGDRLTLVPYDVRAGAVNDASNNKVALAQALDTIALVDVGGRLAPAVALAQRLLSQSERPKRQLVIVSDMQRTGWDLHDGAEMPPGTEVFPVDIGAPMPGNRSIRSVEVKRVAGGAADRVDIAVRIANMGPVSRGVPIALEVSGRPVAQVSVDLPQGGGTSAVFRNVAVAAASAPARVVLPADSVDGDNAFTFLISRAPSIGVLLVHHRDAPEERRLFLSRAFAIGDHPTFDVVEKSADRLRPPDLEGRALVVLNDAGYPAGLGAERLMQFVRDGGGLLNILGEHTSARSWPAQAAALVPGQLGAPVDRLGQRGAVLGYVDYAHPALALFGSAGSGDLSAVRFFRYRAIDTTDGVLARFDDGAAAISEHTVGKGRVLSVGSSLDGVWNDLPTQAVFLPFVHQLAQYAASYRESKRSWQTGDAVKLSDVAAYQGIAASGTRWVVTAPSGKRIGVGGEGEPTSFEPREQGIFEARPGGEPNARPVVLPVNVSEGELDPGTYDVARLTSALAPIAQTDSARQGVGEPVATLAEAEAKQSLWWYLAAAAFIILGMESWLARRTATAPR